MTKSLLRKDVPLPARKYISKYAQKLRGMQVGDSYVFPYEPKLTKMKQMRRLNSNATYIESQHGYVFSLRCLEKGIGIWRVE
jgi:hypothetical protein